MSTCDCGAVVLASQTRGAWVWAQRRSIWGFSKIGGERDCLTVFADFIATRTYLSIRSSFAIVRKKTVDRFSGLL